MRNDTSERMEFSQRLTIRIPHLLNLLSDLRHRWFPRCMTLASYHRSLGGCRRALPPAQTWTTSETPRPIQTTNTHTVLVQFCPSPFLPSRRRHLRGTQKTVMKNATHMKWQTRVHISRARWVAFICPTLILKRVRDGRLN